MKICLLFLMAAIMGIIAGCALIDFMENKKQPPEFVDDAYVRGLVPTPEAMPASIEVDRITQMFINAQSNKSFEVLSDDASMRQRDLSSENEFFGDKLNGLKALKMRKSLDKYTGMGSVDLSDRDGDIVQQWNGTCTAFGLTAAIENLANANGPKIDLSERHTWSRYGKYNAAIAVNANLNKCITVSSKWLNGNGRPYAGYLSKDNCYVTLKKVTYLDDDIQRAIDALDAGRPLLFGTSVTKSMLNCDIVLNPNSVTTGGGHSYSVISYRIDALAPGGGYFKARNSWGRKCHERGYFYLPFSYCKRGDFYCMIWSIDEVSR